MTLYAFDVSHHQGSFDVTRAEREGFQLGLFKATEGSGFVDSRFRENLVKAEAVGLLRAAYHFLRSGISAADQLANVLRVVPKHVPLIPDVELIRDSTGRIISRPSLALTREFVARARDAGYHIPWSYIPRWYWSGYWGSPSLVGLPPLWSSRYVSGGGYASQLYPGDQSPMWTGYGGLPVDVLQFSSSATVAGRTPIDVNAYRGTRAQLVAALNGSTPPTPDEEDDMPTPQEIALAVWQYKNPSVTERDAYFHLTSGADAARAAAGALPELLNDEARLSAVIRENAGETDPAVMEESFYRALKRLLREGVPAEGEPTP